MISHFKMGTNCESDIFPRHHKGKEAVSIALIWENMVGTLDGEVEIYISNDGESFSLRNSTTISTDENIANSVIVFLNEAFNFIKIKVKRNGITSGDFSANIYYDYIKK